MSSEQSQRSWCGLLAIAVSGVLSLATSAPYDLFTTEVATTLSFSAGQSTQTVTMNVDADWLTLIVSGADVIESSSGRSWPEGAEEYCEGNQQGLVSDGAIASCETVPGGKAVLTYSITRAVAGAAGVVQVYATAARHSGQETVPPDKLGLSVKVNP